jgi:hypothetical protein
VESERVVLRLPPPGAVVTWFVTGPSRGCSNTSSLRRKEAYEPRIVLPGGRSTEASRTGPSSAADHESSHLLRLRIPGGAQVLHQSHQKLQVGEFTRSPATPETELAPRR